MRPSTRPLAALAALVILLAAFAVPVFAKEGIDAQLEAPIARDTPGGTTLLLSVWVTMTDETGTHDVEGSPVYVRITGPDGASTSAVGRQSRAGHYTVRLAVPASGARTVEVGMRGTSDLPFNLVGFTIVPGSITARTAQVAPALAAAGTPVARASMAAPRAVATAAPVAPILPAKEPGTTVAPTAAPVEAGAVALVVGALALVVGAFAVLALVRIAMRPRMSGRTPEA